MYVPVRFKLGMMIDATELYILILVYATLIINLESRSQGCKNVKACVTIISQSYGWILIVFGMLSRLVGLMNLIIIMSDQYSINCQGRESNLGD